MSRQPQKVLIKWCYRTQLKHSIDSVTELLTGQFPQPPARTNVAAMTPPPAGAAEVGPWLDGERLFRCHMVAVGDVAVSVSGSQDRAGWTVNNVAVALPEAVVVAGVPIPVAVDLTVDQARELAAALLAAADDAQRRDGLVPPV